MYVQTRETNALTDCLTNKAVKWRLCLPDSTRRFLSLLFTFYCTSLLFYYMFDTASTNSLVKRFYIFLFYFKTPGVKNSDYKVSVINGMV